MKYEKEISAALFTDLKKSEEESYATEIGLFMIEINHTLSKLARWMKPQPVVSNMINLPSGSKIYQDPLGVVLIIAPWNYPFQLSMMPLIGAIAGGNCAVVKPSELAPATALVIEKIIIETFAKEFVYAILGDGSQVVPELMKSFRFDHVFYTGSVAVGKLVYQLAANDLVPVTLELGGKSPAIIERDANLAVAAKRIAMGKFLNAGQTCIAPDYLLVHNDVKNEVIRHLDNAITSFYSKEPSSSKDYSRIVNVRQFDRLVGYLAQGKLTRGGDHNREQLYFGPTLMEETNLESPLMKEEIFGPILPVIGFQEREEAHAIVNRNPNPLAFYLFSGDHKVEAEWISRHRFGGGCINNTVWQFGNHYLPFGGVGTSGMGAYHGKFSFDTFTRKKPVMTTPLWFDPSVKYPPFKGKLKLLKWLFR